jgi:hypothetical protein
MVVILLKYENYYQKYIEFFQMRKIEYLSIATYGMNF